MIAACTSCPATSWLVAKLQRKVSREQATKAVGELKTKGMLINEISPAELGRMRDATKDIAARVTADYDPALVKLVNEELVRIHAAK